MPLIEEKRVLTGEDRADLAALFSAVGQRDEHNPFGEHHLLDLDESTRPEFRALVARREPGGPAVGYAQTYKPATSWTVAYLVAPELRDDPSLAHDLLDAALSVIRRSGGGNVNVWLQEPGTREKAIASSIGLEEGRCLYQMRRSLPLPAALRPGLVVPTRAFRPEIDEAAWLEVNNAAFTGHPEQGSWELATLLERECETWFDPNGLLVAEEDGSIVGFCWTKVHDRLPLGEIYVIAVDPRRHHGGLGGSLLWSGLDFLADKELDEAMLYVDAEAQPAIGLYRKFGFWIDHVDRAFVGEVTAT